MKNLIKNKKGFTIIEVMIVLAVAGVIILIVLLAVPALQRSQHNTQRKSDATNILAAVNDFSSNNNGQLPGTSNAAALVWTAPSQLKITNTALTNPSTSEAKIGYYTGGLGTGQSQINLLNAAGGVLANNVANDRVVIELNTYCNGNVPTAGGARQVAVVYEVETGTNTYNTACIGN